jgi:hypothetical protein
MAQQVRLPSQAIDQYVHAYQPGQSMFTPPDLAFASPELKKLGDMARNGVLSGTPSSNQYVSSGETDDAINLAEDTMSGKSSILKDLSIVNATSQNQWNAMIRRKFGGYADRPEVKSRMAQIYPAYRGTFRLANYDNWDPSPGSQKADSENWLSFMEDALAGKPIDQSKVDNGWNSLVNDMSTLDERLKSFSLTGGVDMGPVSPNIYPEVVRLEALQKDRESLAIQTQAAMAKAGFKTKEGADHIESLKRSWAQDMYFRKPENHEDFSVWLSKMAHGPWRVSGTSSIKEQKEIPTQKQPSPVTSWGI